VVAAESEEGPEAGSGSTVLLLDFTGGYGTFLLRVDVVVKRARRPPPAAKFWSM